MRSLILTVALAACNHSSPSDNVTPAPDGGTTHGDAGSSAPSDGPMAPDAGTSLDAPVADATELDYYDVATVLANAMRVPVDVAVVDGVNMAYGVPPSGFTNTTTGVFTGTHDAIAYTYTYHCEDINAVDTYTCGPGTDHIHWEVDANGTAALPDVNFTEDRIHAHWHIRSIGENQPRVEDTGQFWLGGRTTNDNARITLNVLGTWTHVRYAPQPTRPFAGTVTLSITGHRSRATSAPTDRDFTMTGTITFAATTSTIALDNARTYSIDMTTGAVARM